MSTVCVYHICWCYSLTGTSTVSDCNALLSNVRWKTAFDITYPVHRSYK